MNEARTAVIGYPVTERGRFVLMGAALFLVCGFAVAFGLRPDARGFGTHEQLGLPPCFLVRVAGVRCPGCGMTTCFSYFVRGDVRSAVRANPAGVLLAMVCAGAIPWLLASAVCKRLLGIHDPTQVFGLLLGGLGVACLCVWVARFFP